MENKKIFLFNSVMEKLKHNKMRKNITNIIDYTSPSNNNTNRIKAKRYQTETNKEFFPVNYNNSKKTNYNFKKLTHKNNIMENKRSIPFKSRSISERKNHTYRMIKKHIDHSDVLSNLSNFYFNNTENNYNLYSLNNLKSHFKNESHHFHNDANYIILNKTINSVDLKTRNYPILILFCKIKIKV